MGRQSAGTNQALVDFTTMRIVFGVSLWCFAFLVGCGGVREETIVVVKHDPFANVRSALSNYVNGQPLASEVESFDTLVAEVTAVDAEKGEILEAGLRDLQASSGGRLRSKAKKLMQRLGLDGPSEAD